MTGTIVNDLGTGTPDAAITSVDCEQVAAAMLAVEMRTPPTQCDFQPLLAKDPPERTTVADALRLPPEPG